MSKAEINKILLLIKVTLENLQSNTQKTVELGVEDQISISDWREGVEDLASKTEMDLWKLLSLPEECLPFFQEWFDPNSMIDPWSNDSQAWLNDPMKGRVALRPRWHQLVGILHVLKHACKGKATLLMDRVGLRKMMQAIGTITCLVYYHTYYAQKGDYPNHFG